MVKVLLLSLLFSWPLYGSDPLVDQKCYELSGKLDSESLVCYQDQMAPDLYKKMQDLGEVSSNMQQWVWLSGKAKQVIVENNKKKKILESRARSFLAAKNGYPGGAKDAKHAQVVEEYRGQYEKLYQAAKAERMLKDTIQFCQKPTLGNYRTCMPEKMDDLKLRYADKQAEKLSILMSYPLLSNNAVRESIEAEVELYNKYNAGKSSQYKGMKLADFNRERALERRSGFDDLMLQGIKNTKKALAERQKDWINLYKNGNKIINTEIDAKKREKSSPPKFVPGHTGKNRRNRHKRALHSHMKQNSKLINELLSGTDLNAEFQDPLLGKAICQINEKNKKILADEKRNQMILDGALFVAPFFLGPIGLAARVASLGRVAGWGVKGGRLAVAGAAEGALLYKDITDLAKSAKQCAGLATARLHSTDKIGQEREVTEEEKTTFNDVETCKKDLRGQILASVGGAVLAPVAAIYRNGRRVASSLTESGQKALKRFNDTRTFNAVNKFFRSEKLSAAEQKVLRADFAAFKDSSKLKGDELIAAYRKRYKENFSAPVCSI